MNIYLKIACHLSTHSVDSSIQYIVRQGVAKESPFDFLCGSRCAMPCREEVDPLGGRPLTRAARITTTSTTTNITITFVAIAIPRGQEFANREPQGSQPPASPSSSLPSSSPFRKGRRVLTRATWITTTHRASRGPHISHHPPPVSPFPRSALYHCWCTLPKKKKKSKPVFVIDSS